eukprot:1492795-Amphidinium_carterae.1
MVRTSCSNAALVVVHEPNHSRPTRTESLHMPTILLAKLMVVPCRMTDTDLVHLVRNSNTDCCTRTSRRKWTKHSAFQGRSLTIKFIRKQFNVLGMVLETVDARSCNGFSLKGAYAMAL